MKVSLCFLDKLFNTSFTPLVVTTGLSLFNRFKDLLFLMDMNVLQTIWSFAEISGRKYLQDKKLHSRGSVTDVAPCFNKSHAHMHTLPPFHTVRRSLNAGELLCIRHFVYVIFSVVFTVLVVIHIFLGLP